MLPRSGSLVTLESRLTQRLLDFERLDEAWPKGRTAIERAWIPRVGSPAIDTARAEVCNAAMKRVTAFAVLLVVLAAPAWAGWDEGVAAYDRGDYATALREWRPIAEQGNASAQYNLGVMYYNGVGVPQDDAEAAKWFRKAADQGNASAQFNLGVMYGHGYGVQDYVQAHMWYNLAEAQCRTATARNRGRVAKLMTPAQIAEAQRRAGKWRPRGQGAAPDN